MPARGVKVEEVYRFLQSDAQPSQVETKEVVSCRFHIRRVNPGAQEYLFNPPKEYGRLAIYKDVLTNLEVYYLVYLSQKYPNIRTHTKRLYRPVRDRPTVQYPF